MLQRMSSSISGSGTQGYKLASALQKEDKITVLNVVSMSLTGGTSDSDLYKRYFANQNWLSSGSRHQLSSSNLYVGRYFRVIRCLKLPGFGRIGTSSDRSEIVINKY